MPAARDSESIDALMEQASQALVQTAYFQAERQAREALTMARDDDDFGRMARIIMPLWEARRQRLQQALDVEDVTVVETPIEEDMTIEPGCYLVRPPQVGADARRLRLMALEREIPAAVLCREPKTSLGLCPIVAIAPGVTIRTKVDEPPDPDHPDMAWFIGAMEALGEFAIISLDPALPTLKRLDALLNRLETIPDHEGLHHALEEVCKQAQQEEAGGETNRGGKRRAGSKSKS
ncbi:MAG: hypothetical protein SYC29_05955 [Planctomycetota bacterium]|nr:hypothetical protein [Planctomycetota bacterium]